MANCFVCETKVGLIGFNIFHFVAVAKNKKEVHFFGYTENNLGEAVQLCRRCFTEGMASVLKKLKDGVPLSMVNQYNKKG